MADGKIVEFGPDRAGAHQPGEEYTQRLLADTPSISTALAAG